MKGIARMILFFLLLLRMGFTNEANAKTYRAKTSEEINNLLLYPGDSVVMVGNDWKDAQINFKGKGTETAPIVLLVAQPGKLTLSGNSNLKLDGQWLVANGLYFTNGFSLENDVIIFTKNSSHCRITNTAIINYNPPKKETDYKWLSLYGNDNMVDHCEFTGKTHQGTTLVVWLSNQPNHHIIENNYFGPRPPLGRNGGECIRIGTSEWSMHDSYTLVQNNIFDKCDGETEIVSVKSCRNIIKENLFYECDGTLTLRHGNYNTVEDNYFIGNDKANTGGIRIIGQGHLVKNNYLYKLTGDDLRAAISIMNAFQNPKLNEYWEVKDIVVENNIIVKCKSAFVIGSGKNDKRVVAPDSVAIINNYVMSPQLLLTKKDEIKRLVVSGNKAQFVPLSNGFQPMKNEEMKFSRNRIWVFNLDVSKPFWLSMKTGAAWHKENEFTIR